MKMRAGHSKDIYKYCDIYKYMTIVCKILVHNEMYNDYLVMVRTIWLIKEDTYVCWLPTLPAVCFPWRNSVTNILFKSILHAHKLPVLRIPTKVLEVFF